MKKSGLKKRTLNPHKRVAQDFRRFKNQLKRWIDGSNIVWVGDPYKQGSYYRFEIDKRLSGFVIQQALKQHKEQEIEAKQATLEMAEKVNLATLPEIEDPIVGHDEESDSSFDKFLIEEKQE